MVNEYDFDRGLAEMASEVERIAIIDVVLQQMKLDIPITTPNGKWTRSTLDLPPICPRPNTIDHARRTPDIAAQCFFLVSRDTYLTLCRLLARCRLRSQGSRLHPYHRRSAVHSKRLPQESPWWSGCSRHPRLHRSAHQPSSRSYQEVGLSRPGKRSLSIANGARRKSH